MFWKEKKTHAQACLSPFISSHLQIDRNRRSIHSTHNKQVGRAFVCGAQLTAVLHPDAPARGHQSTLACGRGAALVFQRDARPAVLPLLQLSFGCNSLWRAGCPPAAHLQRLSGAMAAQSRLAQLLPFQFATTIVLTVPPSPSSFSGF